jgi:hypothetical protein
MISFQEIRELRSVSRLRSTTLFLLRHSLHQRRALSSAA